MARFRRTLILTTAIFAVVGVRASGQVGPMPGALPAYPDPAMVLLPPVASGSPSPPKPDRGSDLPPGIEEPAPRPVTPLRVQPVDDEAIQPIAPLRRSAPIANDPPRIQPLPLDPPSQAARPVEPQRVEPAALLRAPEDSKPLKLSDSAAIRSEGIEQTSAQDVLDPYEYLTGRSLKPRGESLGEDDLPRRRSGQAGERFTDRLEDMLGGGRRGGGLLGGRELFRSDHRFDCFISPTTNPFYFEDPRTLTEVRPIFMYQAIPSAQATFQGGSAYFIGGQGRLAITDRISVVVNKIGLSGFSPGGGSSLGSNMGLSELWLGPKVGIIQNLETLTLLSAGATFQIPLGGSSVYQNTGKLSIVPYVSAAQQFLKTEWGAFNALASTGFSFSTNNQRSNLFFLSGHLDYNINNRNRFYPFIEANWFSYTSNGTTSGFGVEGRDLANFGAAASKSNLVTGAVGLRYKTRRGGEIGGAFELPLFGQRDLFRYRFTLDFAWRY